MKKNRGWGYRLLCIISLVSAPLVSAGATYAETIDTGTSSVNQVTESTTNTSRTTTETTDSTTATSSTIDTSTSEASTNSSTDSFGETTTSSSEITVSSTEETDTSEANPVITVKELANSNRYVKINTFTATTTESQAMDSRQVLYTLNQLQLTATGSITELAGHVYKSVKQYQDTATKKKYSELLDEQNHVIGIVEAESVTTADGVFQSEKKYATVQSGNYPLWESIFFDKQLVTTKTINQQTFQVKESFKHGNGSTYYALYTDKNQFIGWINAKGAADAKSPGGIWQSESKYATIISGNYTLWQNFDWSAKKGTTAALNGKTVKATGKYSHVNGATYYSLYDNKNKWLGYINAAGVKTTSNAQGAYQAYGKYVTLTKKNYTIWGNFNWSSKKNTTSSLYGKTYQAKGKYEHWNGSTYYSLSDSTGKWIGYLNAEAATVANNQGGIWQSENKTIRMKSKNYTLWQDLNFSKKKASSGNYMNKNIKVTGKYQHYNGATYYSLYLNNTWIGYINATGVTNAHVIHSQSNISRYVIVNNASGNFLNAADPNSSKLGKKSNYKGSMAKATKLAKTSDGNYLYLVSPAGKIGWIKENQTYSVNDKFWMYTTGGKYPSLNVKNLNIHVSISKQRVYIKSGDKVIYTMLCSTGTVFTPTPLGNFRIQQEKGSAFSGAAYYRSFKDHGVYLFHTVPTSIAWSTNSFSSVEGKKLGQRASHGCIRLAVPDAKWFYYNMPYNTPVKIVN
ncbi:L,D-transpeptidase [Enterococcus gallinarum]|uniref:L,D-transpeptidase family protein n=1 Tax=Enterococcus gallinarum TaxID=1353 RepID=UPI0011DC86ED|nr:L,D-transpeptidase [Enterococcus gallinarum]TXW62442.1 L,D-transpeptidase [Enterococcus gallinarum]